MFEMNGLTFGIGKNKHRVLCSIVDVQVTYGGYFVQDDLFQLFQTGRDGDVVELDGLDFGDVFVAQQLFGVLTCFVNIEQFILLVVPVC